MKLSPVPTTGIAVAAVAAVTVTAVALKKKGKKVASPIASFSAKEWEEVKDWPAVKTVVDKVEALVAEHVSNEEIEPVKESKDSVKDTAIPVAQVFIGDEPGQVKAFGTEYKKIVNKAFKEASDDDTVTLELFGKTYGLGARGEKIERDSVTGTLYSAEDIKKLKKKVESL
jgi:hypothetical protein